MMDLQQKNKDLNFGFEQEKSLIDIINTKYEGTYKTTEKYNHFDFRNDTFKIDIELKSRRIYKGQYPTIFFAQCKLIEGRKRMKAGITDKVIYLFNFKERYSDKRELWFWEDDGKQQNVVMNGNMKRLDIKKSLIDIPCEILKKF